MDLQSTLTGWWVSNIFYFHPYLGKWSNLTNIFQRGWNHQLAKDCQDFSNTWWFRVSNLNIFRLVSDSSDDYGQNPGGVPQGEGSLRTIHTQCSWVDNSKTPTKLPKKYTLPGYNSWPFIKLITFSGIFHSCPGYSLLHFDTNIVFL